MAVLAGNLSLFVASWSYWFGLPPSLVISRGPTSCIVAAHLTGMFQAHVVETMGLFQHSPESNMATSPCHEVCRGKAASLLEGGADCGLNGGNSLWHLPLGQCFWKFRVESVDVCVHILFMFVCYVLHIQERKTVDLESEGPTLNPNFFISTDYNSKQVIFLLGACFPIFKMEIILPHAEIDSERWLG